MFRRTPLPPVTTAVWPTDDGDEVTVVRLAPASPTAPRILFLHGLEGTSRSHYVRGFYKEAAARGWGVDLLLFRTCDGRLNSARRTYHSGETSDPAMALHRVIESAGDAPVALVGVSLGGNVLLRLLAMLDNDVERRICAAVAVSTPYDLARSCAHLRQGSSRIYQWFFVRQLQRKALAKAAQFPGLAQPEAIARSRTLWEPNAVRLACSKTSAYRRSSSARATTHFTRASCSTMLLLALQRIRHSHSSSWNTAVTLASSAAHRSVRAITPNGASPSSSPRNAEFATIALTNRGRRPHVESSAP
jgi:predicted alpha/beta-fold hydrolase